ncbi:MAG: DNA methyltransferase, partial [Candidatus Zixiibacteriota bacterium]
MGEKTRQLRLTEAANIEVAPTYEEIIEKHSDEFDRYLSPKADTFFGFWMQTLADLELLDLELQGLTDEAHIDPLTRTVEFKGDSEFLRVRIAHLEKVRGKTTLYTDFVDTYGDTNAYAFHNLYPYKGKFYPRVVRTLINAFQLNPGDLILDPFNGSGTMTHEATLMGINSVGVDVTPMGVLLSKLKNDLPFLSPEEFEFNFEDFAEILNRIEKKEWDHPNKTIEKLMLAIYFDTVDAFARTSRYKKKGKQGLFGEKFEYIKDCHKKLLGIKEKYNLEFKKAEIIEADVLELKTLKGFAGKFDAIITSPPYFFS